MLRVLPTRAHRLNYSSYCGSPDPFARYSTTEIPDSRNSKLGRNGNQL